MGWAFPWYSSFGSRFNFDYGVSFDDSVQAPTYDYRSAAEWEARGMPVPRGELHGTSVLLRDGDRVFDTYSTPGRGTEQVGGTHHYLDMTALGRQEDWEAPTGRAGSLGPRADQSGAGAASGRSRGARRPDRVRAVDPSRGPGRSGRRLLAPPTKDPYASVAVPSLALAHGHGRCGSASGYIPIRPRRLDDRTRRPGGAHEPGREPEQVRCRRP